MEVCIILSIEEICVCNGHGFSSALVPQEKQGIRIYLARTIQEFHGGTNKPKGIFSLRQGWSYCITLMRYIKAKCPKSRTCNKSGGLGYYGSLMEKGYKRRTLLSEPYVTLDNDWVEYVNTPLREGRGVAYYTQLNQQTGTTRR